MPIGVYERKLTPLKDRLLSRTLVDATTDCWEWQGSRGTTSEHGQIAIGGTGPEGRRLIGTHRASWLVHFGAIPKGMCVCHKCDNPPCVNPAHLFLGTKGDNMRDKVSKGRQPWGKQLSQTKLDLSQMMEIFTMSGVTQEQIATQFGISQARVSYIRAGRFRRE